MPESFKSRICLLSFFLFLLKVESGEGGGDDDKAHEMSGLIVGLLGKDGLFSSIYHGYCH